MKNKYLYYAGVFCCAVVIMLLGVFGYMKYQEGRNVRGQYTFDNTRKNISRLSRISLITPESGEINIIREGNTWKFKEAASYFANVEMLSEFYKMVNNSIILSVTTDSDLQKYDLQTDGDKNISTIIRTYDDENQLLDALVFAPVVDVDNQRYARLENRPFVYTINATERFSGNAESWLPYPLLSITQNIVEEFEWNGEVYNRHYFEKLLQHSAKGRAIMQILQFIEYYGLTTAKDFVHAYPMARARKAKVVTIAGLVYNLYFYRVEGDYWIRIKLTSTKVPHKEVPAFIRNNSKYFDKWIFRLTEEQGRLLYDLDLPTVKRKS